MARLDARGLFRRRLLWRGSRQMWRLLLFLLFLLLRGMVILRPQGEK